MDAFFTTVLTIATIVLIILLIVIGVLIRQGNVSTAFPPNANYCPDNWSLMPDGSSCIVPKTGNVGQIPVVASNSKPPYATKLGNNLVINPSDLVWSSTGAAICNKRTWANNNGISWDGVSNYNGC
jgi:hypothetical protein